MQRWIVVVLSCSLVACATTGARRSSAQQELVEADGYRKVSACAQKGLDSTVQSQAMKEWAPSGPGTVSTSWLATYEVGEPDAQGRYLLVSNTVPSGIQVFLAFRSNGVFAHVQGCDEEVQFRFTEVTRRVPEGSKMWRLPVAELENLFRGKEQLRSLSNLYFIRGEGGEVEVKAYVNRW